MHRMTALSFTTLKRQVEKDGKTSHTHTHTLSRPQETKSVLSGRVLAATSPWSTGEQQSWLPDCWLFHRDLLELMHSLTIPAGGADEVLQPQSWELGAVSSMMSKTLVLSALS